MGMAAVASEHLRGRWTPRLVLTLALGCVLLAACGGDDEDEPATAPATDRPACPAPADALPGTQAGRAPWRPELEHLGERLDAIGLPRLTQEGQELDLHVQLTVDIEGEAVEVPSSIGLNGKEVAGGRMETGFVSAIHTHDDSGLVHVHSPDVRPYTLGQLFDVWGVSLTEDRLGGYCAGEGRELTVESDGERVDGNPRQLELEDGQRISVVYAVEEK